MTMHAVRTGSIQATGQQSIVEAPEICDRRTDDDRLLSGSAVRRLTSHEMAAGLVRQILNDSTLGPRDYAVLIVQHVLPNTLPLLLEINEKFTICGLIPKPSSVHKESLQRLRDKGVPILPLNRSQLETAEQVLELIGEQLGSRKLIIMDIGGYFAKLITSLRRCLGDQLIGVVEDTENGQQKYEAILAQEGRFPCPVLSVARSALKEPEDYLTGQSIVFAVERVLRENDELFNGKTALVLGYGKIGKSIATALSAHNISVWVYDSDPIRRVQALAHGFSVHNRSWAIATADLIFGATGRKSLGVEDFLSVKRDAFIASVTSADDEFDFGNLNDIMEMQERDSFVCTFYDGGRLFHVINKGNAVNFTWHFQSVGSYIFLVACELAASVMKLVHLSTDLERDKVIVLSTNEQREIASNWLNNFGNG